MDALLAMQIHTALLVSLVGIAYMFRLVIKQLSFSLHYKWQYERKLSAQVQEILDSADERRISAYQRLMMDD